MLVSQFNFHLPRELIATSPANPRDSARLLMVGDKFSDLSVKDIPSLLKPGDIMVFNDTKVIPARLFGSAKRVGVAAQSGLSAVNQQPRIEVTLHKQISSLIWKAFARPARKLNPGNLLIIADDFSAKVITRDEGEVTLEFTCREEDFYTLLSQYGAPPLPPYIEREGKKPQKQDWDNYQTIYAKNNGAVAAPTAGLHFTDSLLAAIDARGVRREFVTLHVGAGTFLPVKVEDTKDHKMHSEYGIISQQTADAINRAKAQGGRVVAVGTTSLRLLESAAGSDGVIKPFAAETDIFITPGYKFKIVDALITNFHLPESTLFMLVSAFAGLEKMQGAYAHAIENNYRFYSYGDACWLNTNE